MSVVKGLKCDHSNERYEQYFSAVLFIILYKVCSNFGLYGSPKHSNERYGMLLRGLGLQSILLMKFLLIEMEW